MVAAKFNRLKIEISIRADIVTCRVEYPNVIQNAGDAKPDRFGTDGSEVVVQLINYLIINSSRGKSSCLVKQRIETRTVVISEGASFSRVLLP